MEDSKYLVQEVMPVFRTWIESMPAINEPCTKHGQYFLYHHVNPDMVKNRGEVYDFFSKVEDYARFKIMLEGVPLTVPLQNMVNMAESIVWAVQHDGFDASKYDAFPGWGIDISTIGNKT